MKIKHNKLLLEDLRRCIGGWKYNPCTKRTLIQNNNCAMLGLNCLTCYVHIHNILKAVCK